MQANRIPAAQYLRMSTENQEYSLLNQAEAIAKYADSKGFLIVKTYEDPGRSGLVLRERPGLRALLTDVVGSNPGYEAILVYDVSRWGRFQDSDEAASYEFLCKQAGAQVHYCAESFVNDLSIASSIMKALNGVWLPSIAASSASGATKARGDWRRWASGWAAHADTDCDVC